MGKTFKINKKKRRKAMLLMLSSRSASVIRQQKWFILLKINPPQRFTKFMILQLKLFLKSRDTKMTFCKKTHLQKYCNISKAINFCGTFRIVNRDNVVWCIQLSGC
jgi:hypothetical protein